MLYSTVDVLKGVSIKLSYAVTTVNGFGLCVSGVNLLSKNSLRGIRGFQKNGQF